MGTRTFAYNDALQLESESIDGSVHGLYPQTVTRPYENTGIKGRPNGFRLGSADAPEYTVTYGYDAANGRFASVSWTAGTENGVVNYSYVPNSELLAGYTSDSGIGVSYSYEARRNLKTTVENTYGMSVISRYAYRYDELGRRTDVVNTGTAFAESALSKYGYNDRSEVVSSERYSGTDPDAPGTAVTDESRSYDYDPIGNRKESVAGAQQAVIYETNVLNQYESLKNADETSVASPAYDDDGNMTAYKDKTCIWNAENRLVSVEMSDRKVEFLYDYMGRRARKTVYVGSPGSWSLESEKVFVWDGWNLVQEIAVSGGSSGKYFVYGLDLSQSLQGAGGIGGLLCSVDGGSVRYFLYEANGNVGQLVDGGGVIAAHYEYDAFGNLLHSSGDYADINPFRFSTKYWDDETELYYYGFRYYSADIGIWISRDPIGERGGVNLYGFVGNQPAFQIDPLGLDWKIRVKGAVRIIIGVVGEGAGIAGMGVGAASEGATVGASTPVSVPLMMGSAALMAASGDQIVTGYNELVTGENKVSATEGALAYAGEVDREYDITGKLITLETGVGQYWLVPITEGVAYGTRACSYYLVEVRIGLLRASKTGVANGKKTVTIYRVDDNAYAPRISSDGSIPIVKTRKGNERALFINIGQPQRAKEFAIVNRKRNATVTAIEADASILEKLRGTAVYDKSKAASLNPNAPIKVDIKTPDQYGLRTSEQIQMLRDAIDPSTVRIIDPNDL